MNFPKSTQVNKIMPKEAFYRNLKLDSTTKNAFVSDIKRIVWANKLSCDTLNIEKGENVSEILVLSVELKEKAVNYKIFENISKSNSHKILYELLFENQSQIALFHNKLYKTEWKSEHSEIEIVGFNMDRVWENFVKSVECEVWRAKCGEWKAECGEWNEELSPDENIKLHEKQEKLQKEIARLEKKIRAERQPNKKIELVHKMRELERLITDNESF